MTVISQPIPNLLGGVSQQPYALRSANQGETQENGYSSPIIGLDKRPPTENIGKVSTATSGAAVLAFDRNSTERGTVTIPGDGTIVIKDTTGANKVVTMIAAAGYVTVANADVNIQMVSVGDYIFILNRAVNCAMQGTTAPDNTSGSGQTCVWVRSGQLNRDYTVTLTGLTATTTPVASPNDKTNLIAAALNTAINGVASYTSFLLGSTVFIKRSLAYTVSVTDSLGGDGIVLLNQHTNSPDNLPPQAVDGYQVEITGDISTAYDNYWVQYSNAKSAWIECPAPGRAYQFDATTMPHVLVKNGAGYDYKVLAFNDCPAGDLTTNPIPSFVGYPIQDVFFYRGRLGFLTERTVVMSRANDIFNFWRNSVSVPTDADPIDVQVTMIQPAPMRWATEFNGSMFFSTRRGQYEMALGQNALTPSTVAFRKVAAFEMDTNCRPVVAGSHMYFSAKRGSYSIVLEFYNTGARSQDFQYIYDAHDITTQCPQYITGGITRILVAKNMLLVNTDAADHKVYAYQYAFADDGSKTQSAWHVWPFNSNDTPAGGVSIEGIMYLLFFRADGLWLEQMNLEALATDPSAAFKFKLDRRVDQAACTSSYDAPTDTTTITLPYSDTAGVLQVYGNGLSTTLKSGEELVTTQIADSGGVSRVKVPGNRTAEHFYVGRQYNMRWVFSTIVLRDGNKGDTAVATGGRLTLQRIIMNYGQSGYFKVVVTPKARDTYTYVMTGDIVGSSEVLIGQPHVVAGTFRFPVGTLNTNATIEISNNSPFPSRLLNAAWVGQYVNRARSV